MRKTDDEEGFNELFGYQNIDSAEYSKLDNIIADYYKNGLLLTVCKAYFFGVVTGKRTERRRNKSSSR